ncbi:hypothetical protein PC116_g30048 [Phytophthora cactorum]|nr:hypothetical protein PC116_g30048 [Phytophthora cactorum]
MLQRAQTFPLSINRPIIAEKNETWKLAEAYPFSKMEQKRVCYPNLAPWTPRDGQRKVSSDLEDTIKELRARDSFLGSKENLRDKWSMKFEAANRRLEGTDTAAAPTIMVVAWDENEREYGTEDERLWKEACKDIVRFLRENGAAYFGVEIIHWDRLDYQVVT